MFLKIQLWSFLLAMAKLGNAQGASVSACIAGNVTLKFEPAIDTNRNVSSYTWNKDIGPNKDPSFAKFDAQTNSFVMYMYESTGRIFHSTENPTDLNLTNLKIGDAAKYTLVVRYETFTGNSPEFVVDLRVKDICFNETKEVGECTITTCFTGENGTLVTPNNSRISVSGFEEVEVCDKSMTGNYSCCNAVGVCETRMLRLPEKVEDEKTMKGGNGNVNSLSTGLQKTWTLLIVALMLTQFVCRCD